ncbi:MAG TPA: class I SAM-dependent RNA methyltransferase [Ktedonobacteraceae bacterium]|nr:class I SAM-dependent RNA methyltransferase [Ktedonobacteraceae bacterium]
MISQEQSITYYTVTLGEMTRDGDVLAEIHEQDETGEEHARTLHVPAGLPGEVVTIGVEKPPVHRPGKKRRHWKPRPPRVWIQEIHAASPLRIAAPCPVFGTCGGCQLQHMRYDAQLAWKRDVVTRLLQEIGGFDNAPVQPTEACDTPWHYRNHMRFSVNRSGQPGLTARGTHRVLPLASCPIAHEQINRALSVLSQQPNARPQVLIRCGANSKQMLIQPSQGEATLQKLAEAGLDVRAETMEEQLCGETFRIRPSSFFQTNTAQAEKMAHMVLDGLLDHPGRSGQLEKDRKSQDLTVVDAYCGVGTFALLLARHVSKVIAIEESASAIRDAQWNLRDAANVEILKGKVEDVLPTLGAGLDGLVIDPPRAGCQQVVLDALLRHPVARVVYVSCDPSTLARDLNILCHPHHLNSASGQPVYRLLSVQPLDMFPQTAHIECITTLERIKQPDEI